MCYVSFEIASHDEACKCKRSLSLSPEKPNHEINFYFSSTALDVFVCVRECVCVCEWSLNSGDEISTKTNSVRVRLGKLNFQFGDA